MSIYCPICNKETTNPKYCSSSCAATANNKGRRRHGNPPNDCLQCGKKTASFKSIYCSFACCGLHKRKNISEEDRKRKQRHYFMKYYMKKRQQTPPDADMILIKEIYLNCPAGYEVDHIIPISKGGLHHQDNLQYLTPDENKRKSNKL